MESSDNQLSFGFFKNENLLKNKEMLDLYKENYDVVIRGDGSYVFIEIVFSIITGICLRKEVKELYQKKYS